MSEPLKLKITVEIEYHAVHAHYGVDNDDDLVKAVQAEVDGENDSIFNMVEEGMVSTKVERVERVFCCNTMCCIMAEEGSVYCAFHGSL